MSERRSARVPPSEVHERLAEFLLIDGYRLVLDAERSHGSWLVDARDGREFLDLYTHFASAPLGANPPGIVDDPEFMALLAKVAVGKPANPAMTDRFPVFDWPRIDVPAVTFPLETHRADVEAAEARALTQALAAFERNPHDIACFIAEPIQAEGGDNHLRPEFLQAMQALCHDHDALFVLDEVQTGVGTTGTAWAYQQLGLEPDVVAFGKKVQV